MTSLPFNRNSKTIFEIYDSFHKGTLLVDGSYQRRRVWLLPDKVRLIETILLKLIIPEVFFWPAQIDPETGTSYTHIVDGQQRLRTIVEFISGEFFLNDKYLLNEEIKENFGNKSFTELLDSEKSDFWSYPIFVVNIDRNLSKKDITDMFYRLNLTNYNLNNQEKLNSLMSSFGEKAEALSCLDFWKDYRVFSASDARRMIDVEYCCSIFILAIEGIIDQTTKNKINQYFEDYKVDFDSEDVLLKRVEEAMNIIQKICDKSTLTFASKKAQMYTLFCLSFQLMDKKIAITPEIFERFKLFVEAYSLFKNDYVLNFSASQEKHREINEKIKKYKLASSEGINKIGNRTIRYQELWDICVAAPSEIKTLLCELTQIYSAQRSQNISYDSFDAEDVADLTENNRL